MLLFVAHDGHLDLEVQEVQEQRHCDVREQSNRIREKSLTTYS
jgi:hypothetical protein